MRKFIPPETERKTKFGLLKEAYAIIDGIPKSRFNLDELVEVKHDKSPLLADKPMRPECGSIACAMGWLAMHPKFNAMGLWINKNGMLFLRGDTLDFDDAASHIFNISSADAFWLFGPANGYEERRETNHKRIWKARVREFLKQHGQLKPGR